MINPLRLLRDAVIRYRRTRGFGVHSPFAYGFITQVLRCRYRFYSWDNLEAEVRSSGSIRWNDAKALFRTLNQCRPSAVYISPGAEDIVKQIVRAWSEKCVIQSDSDSVSFYILSGEDSPVASAEEIAGSGGAFFFLDVHRNPLWDSLIETMKRGQTFTNSTSGIAVCDNKLPRHHFEIDY